MKNKTIKLAFVACCALYLGACGGGGSGTITYDSLLAKENQARGCAGLPAIVPTADQKSAFLTTCNSADFAILDQAATCAVNLLCNKSGTNCTNLISKLSSGCATLMAKSASGGTGSFFSGGF